MELGVEAAVVAEVSAGEELGAVEGEYPGGMGEEEVGVGVDEEALLPVFGLIGGADADFGGQHSLL